MNYNDELEKMAKKGFEFFMSFIKDDRNLLYEVNETEDDETEIEVSIYDEDMCTDFLGRFYFDNNGKYLENN